MANEVEAMPQEPKFMSPPQQKTPNRRLSSEEMLGDQAVSELATL